MFLSWNTGLFQLWKKFKNKWFMNLYVLLFLVSVCELTKQFQGHNNTSVKGDFYETTIALNSLFASSFRSLNISSNKNDVAVKFLVVMSRGNLSLSVHHDVLNEKYCNKNLEQRKFSNFSLDVNFPTFLMSRLFTSFYFLLKYFVKFYNLTFFKFP